VSIYLWNVEKADSVVKILANWNYQVHVWLKYYVQHRLVEPGQHPTIFATFMTFMTSAIWHGIYPMYFFCFVYIYVISEVCKDFYKAGDKINKFWPLTY
jgi:lysophospholipid acyltransferase